MIQERNSAMVELLTPDFLRREEWQDWTPTLTQGGALGNLMFARYAVLGPATILTAKWTIGGAGTGGQPFTVAGIPAALSIRNWTATMTHGTGLYFDIGNCYYTLAVVAMSAVSLRFVVSGAGQLGSNPSFAAAITDELSFTILYERA